MKENLLTFAVPSTIWAVSYVYLAVHHRKVNLINIQVHETGRYTLLQTLCYFSHFLRELPIDTLYTLCIFWTFSVVDPEVLGSWVKPHSYSLLTVFVFFLLIVFSGSVIQVGLKNSLLDLLQARETDEEVAFGAHWQMHGLSTLSVMLIFVFPATFFELDSVGFISSVFVSFILLSLLYKTGIRSFTDERWILHGSREILTFCLLIGIPWLFPLISRIIAEGRLTTVTAVVALVLVLLGAYYTRITLRADVRKASRALPGLSTWYLIFSHFFEHALDFFYVALLLLTLESWVPQLS